MNQEQIERVVAEVMRRLGSRASERAAANRPSEPSSGLPVRLLTQEAVLEAAREGASEVRVMKGCIVTPLALETLNEKGIELVEVRGEVRQGAASTEQVRGTIGVGADRRGLALQETITATLRRLGRQVIDCAPASTTEAGYVKVAEAVATAVAKGEVATGIVMDAGGTPSAIVANKVSGVRAVACNDVTSAKYARSHVDANLLCVGVGTVGDTLAREIVDAWIKTPFEGGEFEDRIREIIDVERRR